MPTASGSRAATRLRNTSSENRSRIGEGEHLRPLQVGLHLLAHLVEGDHAATHRHPRLARQPPDERVGRVVLVRGRVERHGQVDRPPVLRDQRRRPRAPRRPHGGDVAGLDPREHRVELALGRRRARLGAEPDEHERVGRGRAAGRPGDRVARPDRLRLRVGEVVARVEQPDDRAAERAGREHDGGGRDQDRPPAAVDHAGERVEHSAVLRRRPLAPGRRPRALARDRPQVERLRDVEQHPVGEEAARRSPRRRPRARSPRPRAARTRRGRRPGSPGPTWRRSPASASGSRAGRRSSSSTYARPIAVSRSPSGACAAARRNASATLSSARSTQARNSSFLVRKSRNRYGWEMPASRAMSSVEVPCSPPIAKCRTATARISSRRSSADLRTRGSTAMA